MRTLFRNWPVACFIFLIHTLLVCAVYGLYLFARAHPGDEPEMQWLWAGLFDFPASLLVEAIHPSYGIQCALAFFLVGGIQWFILGAVFDLLFSRRRHGTPTV